MMKDEVVLALGTFDGMHLGHRAVVRRAVALSKELGVKSAVYTFSNHPRSVFGEAPPLIMTPEEKRAEMIKLGVDIVDLVLFTRALADREPAAFLVDLLKRYRLRALVAGSDFTYGRGGAGDMDALRDFGERRGILVEEIPFVTLDGEKVSSTRLRGALRAGDAELIKRLLGKE